MKIVKDRQWYRQLSHNMAQSGQVAQKPPLGYKVAIKDGVKIAIPDPIASLYVKDLFNYYSTKAYSLDQLVEKLGNKHQVWVTRATLHRTIRSKYYIGTIVVKGEEYPHPFEQFISKELWEECNSILSSYRKKITKYRGKKFLFRGCITCSQCGAYFTGEQHKGLNYYRCSQSKFKKELHPDRGYLKEESVMDIVLTHIYNTNIDASLIQRSELRCRLFMKTFFSLFTASGKDVQCEVNPDGIGFDWKRFLKSDGLHGFPYKESKEVVKELKSDDPFVRYCQKERSIDDLMENFSMDIDQVQSKLMDYQLNDLIEETETGLWKTI